MVAVGEVFAEEEVIAESMAIAEEMDTIVGGIVAVENMVVGEEIVAAVGVGVENMVVVEVVALAGSMVIIVVEDTVVVEVLVEVLVGVVVEKMVESMVVGVALVGDKVGVECKDPVPGVQGIVVVSTVQVDKVEELVEHWKILG